MRSADIYRLLRRRQRRLNRRERSLLNRTRQGSIGCGSVILLLLAVGLLALSAGYVSLTANLPSLAGIPHALDPQTGLLLEPTRLYDRSGEMALLSLENPGIARRSLPLDPNQPEFLSPRLVQLTIALQEPAFWNSPGINPRRLRAPEPQTIAEQLVDRLLLWDEPPGMVRTLHLRLLAAQLVATYGRTQVLEWHLNSAYFGHLAYGADSAAQLYLEKPASQLNLAESALLLAVQETPALNPLDAPAAALERQQEVLEKLLNAGVINQEEYDNALQSEPVLRQAIEAPHSTASAFTHLALEALYEDTDRQRIEMGGLRILTTLDGALQAEMDCALRTQLQRQEAGTGELILPEGGSCEAARLLPTLPPSEDAAPTDLMSSALILDPLSGQVLALLGETTLEAESPLLQAHEPGSLLTPFVAMAGFTRGFSPGSLVWDIPASLPPDLEGRGNPDGVYHGPLRLRSAIANDYLVPLSQLLAQISPGDVWRLAEPFGLGELARVEEPLDVLYSGGELTLLDIAQAYSLFAAGGVQYGRSTPSGTSMQPVLILSIEDLDGRSWQEETPPDEQSVLTPQLAYLVHDVLSDNIARRPSLGYPNPLDIGLPSAAKIGQTADGDQVWTAGYTRHLVTVVWVGLQDEPETDFQPLNTSLAADLWHALQQYAGRAYPVEDWQMPLGISVMQVCDPSGLLPTRACPSLVSEKFLSGNEPTSYDSLYRSFQINQETGALATVFTPLELVEERTFLVLPPEAQAWAEETGVEHPPTGYDSIQAPPHSAQVSIFSPQLFSYVGGNVLVRGTAGGEGFVSYRLQVGEGLNPQNWLQIGEEGFETVDDGVLGTWDTTGQEGLYALRLLVQRDDQHIETAVIQVTVDNTPPALRVPYPRNGDVFTLPTQNEITLQAEVEEAIGIKRVAWYIDGEVVGERSKPPYSLPWETSLGEHELVVRATDLANHVTVSEPVVFEVTLE